MSDVHDPLSYDDLVAMIHHLYSIMHNGPWPALPLPISEPQRNLVLDAYWDLSQHRSIKLVEPSLQVAIRQALPYIRASDQLRLQAWNEGKAFRPEP